MNITTRDYVSSTQTIDNQSYGAKSLQNSSNNDSVSFKDELKTIQSNPSDKTDNNSESAKTSDSEAIVANDKSKDVKSENDAKDNKIQQTSETNPDKNIKDLQKDQEANASQNSQELKKGQKASESKTSKNANKDDTLSTIKELNSQIKTMKNMKNIQKLSSNITNKTTSKISHIDSDKKFLKMDLNDAKFFINLVQNQQFEVQNNPNVQNSNTNNVNNTTAVLQNTATQQAVDVSNVLMTQLQSSMQTNKPFRIDFDNNIAVVMKVDKEGKLSANFIPGDQAVEAYLKANIPALQQSFDSQNLPYKDLSYSHSRQNNQQENNHSRKKEENDE